jgi:hypothetical protein
VLCAPASTKTAVPAGPRDPGPSLPNGLRTTTSAPGDHV